MTIPLADAIREARRAADEARLALTRLQQARAALRGLDLIAQQRVAENALDGLPGDDLFAELGGRADLEAVGGERSDRIAARREWLRATAARLEGLAAEAEARAEDLHELQEAQRRLLDQPEHAALMARLSARREEQRELGGERASLERRVLQLETGLRTLDLIRGVLRTEIGAPEDERAAHLAREAMASLQRVFREIGLDLPLPDVSPERPLRGDPLGAAVDALGDTRGALLERLEPLRRARDERRHRHEALTRSILDEMG